MEVLFSAEVFSHQFLPEKAPDFQTKNVQDMEITRSAESFFIEVSPEKAQSDKFSQSAEVFFPKSPQSPIALPHANSAIFSKTQISHPISNLPNLGPKSPFRFLNLANQKP